MQSNITFTTKRRIAAIIWRDGTGGAERSLTDLAAALDCDKIDMRFYYLSGRPGHFAQQIQRLGFETDFLNWKNGYDIKGRVRLLKNLKRYNPHLIHDHILPPLTRPFIKLFIRCPILYTEHGVACNRAHFRNKANLRKLVERFDLLFCDLVAANSQASAVALQWVYNLPKHKIKVLHLGINLKNLSPVKERSSQFIIGYLGRILNTPKGVDRLPHIAKYFAENILQDFKMLIAGDGPDRVATEKACSTLGVDKYFHFLGWVTDVQSFFSQISVLVIPSKFESFGLIAIEALAMGVPVVAFNTGGLSEILEECPNGFLVQQDDVEGMVKAIVLANETSQESKDAGRRHVQQFFSNTIMARNFENIYEQMIEDQL